MDVPQLRLLNLPLIPRRRRSIALAFSLVVHLVALSLIFWPRADRQPIRPERGIAVFEVLSDADAEEQRLQDVEKPVVDVTTRPAETLFPVELPLSAVEAASSGPSGEACRIAAALQADFLIDDAARAEIAAIPFDARSVANAIVLWVGAPDHVRPVLPATDAMILKRLQSVPAQCLDLDQVGPDFIYAGVDNRTVSIAIGSGQWRWRSFFDLLTTSMRPLPPAERTSPMRD